MSIIQMTTPSTFSADFLRLDPCSRNGANHCLDPEYPLQPLRRRGAVIGVSGGIDSCVVAFLCARALGSERIQILFTPEADSSPDSLRLGQLVATALKARSVLEDISAILKGAGCYERRDDAVRLVVPEYGMATNARSCCRGFSMPAVTRSSPSLSSHRTDRSRKFV